MHSTGIGLEKSYPLLFLGFGAQGGVESEFKLTRKLVLKSEQLEHIVAGPGEPSGKKAGCLVLYHVIPQR